MIEHIKAVFKEVVETSDYSLIREKLSLEERNYFLSNTSLFDFSEDIELLEADQQALFFSNFYKNDEALEVLKKIDNYDNVVGITAISSLSDDSVKKKYLNKVSYDDIRMTIILSFREDEDKIDCLDKVVDENYRFLIISSLETVENKIKCLDKLESDGRKVEIIAKFSHDEDKIKGLNSITSDFYKAQIISGFDSDEKKIPYLDEIQDDFERTKIVSSFENDEDKIRYLDKIQDDYERMTIVSSFENDEDKIKGLDKIENDERKVEIIAKFSRDEDKIRCLDKIENDHYRARIISDFKSKEKKIEALSKIKDGSALTDAIKSIGTDEELSEILKGMNFEYYPAYEKIKKPTSVDDKALLRLTYEQDEMFRSVLENEEALNKFVEFFQTLKESSVIDKSSMDSILEAVILKEFSQKQADVWTIFSTIKGMADRKEVDDITRELYSILSYSENTKNLVGADLEKFKNEFILDNESLKKFVIDLVSGDDDTKKVALDRLRKITSQYINLKIEDYKIGRKKELYGLLDIDRKIDRNFLIKNVIENNDLMTLTNLIKRFYPDRLTSNVESALKDRVEKNPNDAPKEVKAFFKEINNIFVDLYNNHYKELCELFKRDGVEEIKYDENIKIDNSSAINLLFSSTDNLNEICHLCLHGNPLEYDRVINLIKKYHLMGLGSNFSKLFEKVGIRFNSIDVITNISKVAKRLGKMDIAKIEKMKLIDVLIFASPIEELEKVLGEENASLILRNPPDNAAPLTSGARINMVSGYINKMYEKREVNVPTIDTNYTLESGKKMNVQVGNFTNPINLTYGERTGACMRIGGAGDKLFDFCLENPAGFHIKFSLESGEFVSRVSGFRVGNTLFLNELRDSCLEDFNNQDVIEACQRIAKDIIEESKKSEYPIENVVVSDEFALKGSKSFINLDVSLGKDGVKAPGYYDVKPKKCILLATSNNDSTREFVPFKDTPMPEYDVLRDKVQYMSDSDEIKSSISRVHMISEILDGKELLELSEPEIVKDKEKEYKGAFVGEDFYVAVDKDGNIEDYIMPNTKDMERANKEVRESLNRLKDAINRTILENRTMTTMEPVYEEEEVIHHSRGHAMFVMIMIISFILSLTTIIIGVSKYIGK